MRMTLVQYRLPPELDARLRAYAEVTHQSISAVVRTAIEAYLAIPDDLRDDLRSGMTAMDELTRDRDKYGGIIADDLRSVTPPSETPAARVARSQALGKRDVTPRLKGQK